MLMGFFLDRREKKQSSSNSNIELRESKYNQGNIQDNSENMSANYRDYGIPALNALGLDGMEVTPAKLDFETPANQVAAG